MWKTFAIISIPLFLLAGAFPVYGVIEIRNPLEAENIVELIDNLIGVLYALSIPLVTLFVIISAYYFLTSAGDEKKLQKAKQILLYTVIGFGIILASKIIIEVIKDILGVTS